MNEKKFLEFRKTCTFNFDLLAEDNTVSGHVCLKHTRPGKGFPFFWCSLKQCEEEINTADIANRMQGRINEHSESHCPQPG